MIRRSPVNVADPVPPRTAAGVESAPSPTIVRVPSLEIVSSGVEEVLLATINWLSLVVNWTVKSQTSVRVDVTAPQTLSTTNLSLPLPSLILKSLA